MAVWCWEKTKKAPNRGLHGVASDLIVV